LHLLGSMFSKPGRVDGVEGEERKDK
jgi:hypothetical protein